LENDLREPEETCEADSLGHREEQSELTRVLTAVELTTVADTEKKNQTKKNISSELNVECGNSPFGAFSRSASSSSRAATIRIYLMNSGLCSSSE
jgi:hypothetical protein